MSNGTTTREQFAALQDGHKVVPVIRELFADGETPVGIYRKLAAGRPGSFLLESAEQGGIWSRYSFIGVSSFGVLTQTGDRASWQDYGLSEQRALGPDAPTAPLEALARLYERWTTPRIPGHPPLTGGLVGFIGWEAIRQIENLPDRPPADFTIPGQALSFVRELVVVDHRTGSVLLIATALNDGIQSADAQWESAQGRLDTLQEGLAQPAEA
ncbi:MAG TPA: anthranilate synthase component I, partial [Terrimesophilobacter sp.]|nr:anthranilate synthase component I [Terrimesophilobacter sp.]